MYYDHDEEFNSYIEYVMTDFCPRGLNLNTDSRDEMQKLIKSWKNMISFGHIHICLFLSEIVGDLR